MGNQRLSGAPQDRVTRPGLASPYRIALVLLTETRDHLAEGHINHQAIRLVRIQSLRPKLMTASCAVLGLLLVPFARARIIGTDCFGALGPAGWEGGARAPGAPRQKGPTSPS